MCDLNLSCPSVYKLLALLLFLDHGGTEYIYTFTVFLYWKFFLKGVNVWNSKSQA